MFLRQRATQAEYFDSPDRTLGELRGHYAELNRLNRLTASDLPVRKELPLLVGPEACRSLRILDVGAGDGFLARRLEGWAAARGWRWEFTTLDHCAQTAHLVAGGRHVIGSATALPFGDGSFDVVTAMSMTHHLGDDSEVEAHFREAGRVARLGVIVCDLHRNVPLLAGLWAGLFWMSRGFREDAMLSVRRAWRVEEWEALARRARLLGARTWRFHGTRVVLSWSKVAAGGPVPPPPTPAVPPG